MRKQGFVLAACAAVAIGCGGGGGGGSRNGSGTTATVAGGMTVNLDRSYGRVEVSYLTGPGRAEGDLYLEITGQTISNPGANPFGSGRDVIFRDGTAPIRLPLDGYLAPSARLPVPFGATTSGRLNSRNFSVFTFSPSRLLVEGATGGLTDTGAIPGVNDLPIDLDARIRVFAGRTSTVPVFVSSQSFQVDPSTGAYTFFPDIFKSLNYSTTGTDPDAEGKLASRLSDFVRFSLANVPPELQPQLRDGDGNVLADTAGYVYFSGDNVALSSLAGGAGSVFQEVGENFEDTVIGKWAPGSSGGFQGTYDLRGDFPPTSEGAPFSQISVYGSFRDYNQVLSGGSGFDIVMFPNSGETYTFEDDGAGGVRGRGGDIVAFVRDANNRVVNMYYGTVDLGAGTFQLFPIRYLGLDPAEVDAGDILSGNVNEYTDQNGLATSDGASVRYFKYAFASDVSALSGFTATGTGTVFRR